MFNKVQKDNHLNIRKDLLQDAQPIKEIEDIIFTSKEKKELMKLYRQSKQNQFKIPQNANYEIPINKQKNKMQLEGEDQENQFNFQYATFDDDKEEEEIKKMEEEDEQQKKQQQKKNQNIELEEDDDEEEENDENQQQESLKNSQNFKKQAKQNDILSFQQLDKEENIKLIKQFHKKNEKLDAAFENIERQLYLKKQNEKQKEYSYQLFKEDEEEENQNNILKIENYHQLQTQTKQLKDLQLFEYNNQKYRYYNLKDIEYDQTQANQAAFDLLRGNKQKKSQNQQQMQKIEEKLTNLGQNQEQNDNQIEEEKDLIQQIDALSFKPQLVKKKEKNNEMNCIQQKKRKAKKLNLNNLK